MERITLSVRRFRRLAIVTTVLICLLVVAGGVVRLTGSGLGCDDWPNCNDTRFIDVSSGHAAIEQVNRIFSGLIGIPVLALAIGSYRLRPRRRDLRWPSVGVLVTVLANAVVGGIAVRGDLHPMLVQSHFLLAMTSIAFCLVVVRRAGTGPASTPPTATSGRPPDPTGGRLVARLGLALGALVVLALVTGTVVTGTGPHAGEEDVRRFGFDISDVARIHSVSVLLAASVALAMMVVAVRRSELRGIGTRLSTWTYVAVAQGAIGYVQYFNGVPEVLVGIHIAGATLLWVLTVQLVQDALATGDSDRSGAVAEVSPSLATPVS